MAIDIVELKKGSQCIYKLISVLSLLIRQFCLPNPFECFGDSALLINWIAGTVMAPITYLIVGLVYEKGSEPVLGSMLYLITYALLTGILHIMGISSFAWWWIKILVVVFIGSIIGIRIISEKIETSSFRN